MEPLVKIPIIAVVIAIFFTACSKDDNFSITPALEMKTAILNKDIVTLQKIIAASENNVMVISVSTMSNGRYSISLSNGETLSIYPKLTDLSIPKIEITNENNKYYWGNWLTDAFGETRIAVTNPLNPIIGIDSKGYWTVAIGDDIKRLEKTEIGSSTIPENNFGYLLSVTESTTHVNFLIGSKNIQLTKYIPVPHDPVKLPTLVVNTSGRDVSSKDTWITNASYTLLDQSGKEIMKGTTDIKGRGNFTWNLPKKPYSLKLTSKASLLGMPSHRRWTLLANYIDKTLLRTEVAFKMSEILDNIPWTPRSEQIDFHLNNSYEGVYQLVEAIKLDVNRVKVSSTISDKNPDGGYLLEIDGRWGEIFAFSTTTGVVFCCSDPDDGLDKIISGESRSILDKIKADVQHVEDVLYSNNFTDPENGYRKYIDVPSFIDWYLVNEITKNFDSNFYTSVFLFFDPDEKKYFMGPVWDFDTALGNADFSDIDKPEGFWVKNEKWPKRLFEDPYFVGALKTRWNEKKASLEALSQFIDERAAFLDDAQKLNFTRWKILDTNVWPSPISTGNYQSEIIYMKSYLSMRLRWLDTAINNL